MKKSISYISYGLDSATKDSITVAIVYVCESGENGILVSKKKLEIVKSLVREPNYSFFKKFINMCKKHDFTQESLDQLSKHQTGIVRVTPPTPFAGSIEDIKKTFEIYINRDYRSDLIIKK
jgi:hypothetical protein